MAESRTREARAVRVAGPRDLDAIVELDRRCFPAPWSASSWRAELEAEDVLVLGRPLLGLACARVVLDFCELRRIAVDSSVRREGLGRDLLFYTIEHARRKQCARVELEVGASNRAAIALYAGFGFEAVGTRFGYYTAPPDDALLMTLELAEPAQNSD